MVEEHFDDFSAADADSEPSPNLELGAQPTLTIELDTFHNKDLTTSGSFKITSDIWVKTFGKLLEALPLPGLLLDPQRRIIAVNRACAKMNITSEDAIGKPLSSFLSDSPASTFILEGLDAVLATRKPGSTDGLIVADHNSFWARTTFRSIRIQDMRFVLMLVHDMTRERRQQLLLERMNKRLREEIARREAFEKQIIIAKQEWERTFDAVPDLIMILNMDGQVVRLNQAMAAKSGLSPQEAVGKKCYELMHNSDAPIPSCPFRRIVEEDLSHADAVIEHPSGGAFHVSVSTLRSADGSLLGCVHVCRDISEMKTAEKERESLIRSLKAAQEKILFEAHHDQLTGLLNRRGLREAFEREYARSRRERKPLGLMLADVDDFKLVNDEHGHEAGDSVLMAIGQMMRLALRPYDLVGRFGGDEFLALLPGCDTQTAKTVAERVQAFLSNEQIPVPKGILRATISCGVASFDCRREDGWDAIIRAADKALYRAKSLGKNRVEEA